MLTFTATPTGGIGQPLHPARPSRRPACGNDHANPERAGDCACAELAAEAAERASGDCAWDTAAECHRAQAEYLADNGERWSRCRHHPIATYRLAALAATLAATPALSQAPAKLDLAS